MCMISVYSYNLDIEHLYNIKILYVYECTMGSYILDIANTLGSGYMFHIPPCPSQMLS